MFQLTVLFQSLQARGFMKCFSLQVAPRCLLAQVTMDTEVHNVSGCRYITGDR